jgi:hypothetical protein
MSKVKKKTKKEEEGRIVFEKIISKMMFIIRKEHLGKDFD